MPGAMGVDRVDLPPTALDDSAYLVSLVETYIPCSRESWTQFQLLTTKVLSYAHTQAGSLQARSEVDIVRHSPLMDPAFTHSTNDFPTSVMPVSADTTFRVDDENFSATWSDAEPMSPLTHKTCLFQRPNMPACDTRTPLVRGIGGISPVVSSNPQILYPDYESEGEPTGWGEDVVDILSIQRRRCELSGNYFPSSGSQSTGNCYALPQDAPQDQGLPIPAPIDKGMPDLSAFFPSHQISHVLLETQGKFLEASRDNPQPSSKPVGRCAQTSFSRNTTTSSKQQAKQHGVRYQCEICRREFAQPQGVRRHQLEKHKPNFCPHCRTFSWGRLYQFKQHLKKEHPEVDLETAAFNVARRCHQSGPIATTDRTRPHIPLTRSTSGQRPRRDTRLATVWPSPTEPRHSPPLPSLDPFSEALDTECEDARPGSLYPLRAEASRNAVYAAAVSVSSPWTPNGPNPKSVGAMVAEPIMDTSTHALLGLYY
ncbi:hypothetical protein BJY52DRAFT_1417929 [Lactarius psammicola]|nr:hypothetical protein BJY52DRAFT_1417929 [Lactarius psammicola]